MLYSLFTDGACQPNPGKGGWAFILYPEEQIDNKIVKTGYEPETTNNRMEITAVLEGLKQIEKMHNFSSSSSLFVGISVVLWSDSKYTIKGVGEWMRVWHKRGWKRKDKKPLLNVDLWKQIYEISKNMNIRCEHILGHSGHPENEECDQLAVLEIQNNQ